MPYKLRKAPNKPLYWVVDNTGKKYEKNPIPLERAKKQITALRIHLKHGGSDPFNTPPPSMFDTLKLDPESVYTAAYNAYKSALAAYTSNKSKANTDALNVASAALDKANAARKATANLSATQIANAKNAFLGAQVEYRNALMQGGLTQSQATAIVNYELSKYEKNGQSFYTSLNSSKNLLRLIEAATFYQNPLDATAMGRFNGLSVGLSSSLSPTADQLEYLKSSLSGGLSIPDFTTSLVRQKYTTATQKWVKANENQTISAMVIRRAPIAAGLNVAFNLITAGQWTPGMRAAGYDQMYHLGVVITEENGKSSILEKLSSLNFSDSITTVPNTEYRKVSIPAGLTVGMMLDKTFDFMGSEKYFKYDAFANNCQTFIYSLLKSNGLGTQADYDWLLQPLDVLLKNEPGFLPGVAKTITNIGAIWDTLFGGMDEGYDAEMAMYSQPSLEEVMRQLAQAEHERQYAARDVIRAEHQRKKASRKVKLLPPAKPKKFKPTLEPVEEVEGMGRKMKHIRKYLKGMGIPATRQNLDLAMNACDAEGVVF